MAAAIKYLATCVVGGGIMGLILTDEKVLDFFTGNIDPYKDLQVNQIPVGSSGSDHQNETKTNSGHGKPPTQTEIKIEIERLSQIYNLSASSVKELKEILGDEGSIISTPDKFM